MARPEARRFAAALAEFERLRPHLLRVAAGLLGSAVDAEDVVQEAWLRFQGADRAQIRSPRAWLTTTVAHLSLDLLTSAHRRREYLGGARVGVEVADPAALHQPAERVLLDDLLVSTLRHVLAVLSPAERAAFLLHDVFGFTFREVAEAIDRTPQACRQLAVRARRRMVAGPPRFRVPEDQQARLIEAFVLARAGADLAALLRRLGPVTGGRGSGRRA